MTPTFNPTLAPLPCCDLPNLAALPERERKVLAALRSCVGLARAISKTELPKKAGLYKRNNAPDEDGARDAITTLILEHGVPVCSSASSKSGGYFLPEHHREIERCRAMIESYIAKLKRREAVYTAALGDRQMALAL